MKNVLYIITILLLSSSVNAQPKGSNLIGVTSGYYYAVQDPTPNIWWSDLPDETFNFQRGNITKFNFQRDMRLSKRTFFSPSAFINYTSTTIDRAEPNGVWRSLDRNRAIFGGVTIRFKRYLYNADDYRIYLSGEVTNGISLYETNNRFVSDLNGDRTTITRGSVFRRNNGFFPDAQSTAGINIGYENQIDKNSFYYLQAGYSRVYTDLFFYDWSTLNKHYFNVGIGIGFHKFKAH